MIDLAVIGGRLLLDPSVEPVEAAVGIDEGRIVSLGADTPAARRMWDVEGRLVTAGLVEAHTHLVFGGERVGDFRRRLAGATYEQIASDGGGIRSTVEATRAAPTDELVAAAVKRLRWLASNGATTVEVKSGYGLDLDQELRMLEVARTAAALTGVRVSTTLLPLHVVPPDEDRAAYVDAVCRRMLPAAVGRADAVDVFIEGIAFSLDEARRCFEAAQLLGFPVKAHVGQFSDLGGARLAADVGALSVDHCEHVPATDAAALAEAGTVAVLVPGASLFLDEGARPPVSAFREHGVRMAVSTDLNPGSSPLASLPMAAALAVHRFGLTPEEALAGITTNAAAAIGVAGSRGAIRTGFAGDLAVWDVSSPIELVYWLGAPICHATVAGGNVVEWSRS